MTLNSATVNDNTTKMTKVNAATVGNTTVQRTALVNNVMFANSKQDGDAIVATAISAVLTKLSQCAQMLPQSESAEALELLQIIKLCGEAHQSLVACNPLNNPTK